MIASTAPRMGGKLYGQLSLMMFLQYAIWGAWLPILYPFLMGVRGFSLTQCGLILAAGAAGAIIGPFAAGQLADRHFATEKFLAASHLAGAILVWFLAGVDSFAVFLVLSIVYGLIYAPTISLTNSLAFHHMPDRDRDFGWVRVWGTVGWIAAGIAMGHWLLNVHTPADATPEAMGAAQNLGRADAFKLASILGVIMAVFCMFLPHTPPAKEAKEKSATFAALSRVKFQPLLTLFIVAVPISMVHQFYFVYASEFLTQIQNRAEAAQDAAAFINNILGVGGGGLMTVGQMTEIGVLLVIPLIAKTVSRKTLLTVGIIAYVLRMVLFAYSQNMFVALAGVALHGFCFGCFIFVAYMVVDEECPSDVRASAQNLFNLVIVGIGIIVGSWFATTIVGEWAKTGEDGMVFPGDFTRLFSVPMWIAVGCLVFTLALYPGKKKADAAGAAA